MSNSIALNPPFRFEGRLNDLNSMFRPVEKFEIIRYSESISKSASNCFNLIGSICGYISARNKSEAMMERYAIIEEALRESLKIYKYKVDIVTENIKETITRELKIFEKEVEKNIEQLRREYRLIRDKLNQKLREEEVKKYVKDYLLDICKRIKKFIKVSLEEFKDVCSNFYEYTRLNDEYIEFEREYIKISQL